MFNDLRAAFALLTLLPVGSVNSTRLPGYSFAYFPLVGIALGLLLYGIASLPFPMPEVRGFMLLLVWVVAVGGLHLDGFADSCDGLFATAEPERRLAIMRDPRTGAWGAIGLILLLLGKWLLLCRLPAVYLILPPIIGRWWLVRAAYAYPYARKEGMGSHFRAGLGASQFMLATLILIISIGAGVLGGGGLLSLIASVVSIGGGFIVAAWASRRLDGLTGDVYGALCELTELLCLLVMAWHAR